MTQAVPASARAVIVGAGIAGAGVAHHLAERGWDEIVVVDAGPLFATGGSTSHAPGLVFQHNPSRTMTRLAQWTVETLSAHDCLLPGRQHRGGHDRRALAPSSTAAGARARGYGLDAQLLDPAQVAELIPLIDPATILGGFHVADDGIAKAVRAAEALCSAPAIAAFGGCEVTGLRRRGRPRRRRWRRRLARSAPSTSSMPRGIWGRQAAKLAPGLNIPLEPVAAPARLHGAAARAARARRARSCTRSCATRTTRCTSARSPTRYAIGNYRHEPRLADPERPAELPFTPEDFAAAAAEAGRLLPALRDVELTRAFNGLMSFTPDGFPLLGESAAARGLWLAQAIWVTHSAGCGRALAELMTHGDALLDLHECDPQRFDAHGTSRTYQRARGAQGYREVYDVIHPRQQSEQVRGPAHDAVLRAPGSASARSSSRAPAGSARSGTRPTASC